MNDLFTIEVKSIFKPAGYCRQQMKPGAGRPEGLQA